MILRKISLLFITLQVTVLAKEDPKRDVPDSNHNYVRKFYKSTPVGPYYDINFGIRVEDYIRGSQILYFTNLEREEITQGSKKNLSDTYSKDSFVKIVKYGAKKRTIADWFLFYKGHPLSLFACCLLGIPILFAGFIQMIIDACRAGKGRVSRRTWEFPLVPVLLLQQTPREYLLRKKTIRRFCIQWEVGRINIRMNTRLVDLRQILHPPTKKKKAHKYTTWRIIRLICRFNAVVAMRRDHEKQTELRIKQLRDQRKSTWKKIISESTYIQNMARNSNWSKDQPTPTSIQNIYTSPITKPPQTITSLPQKTSDGQQQHHQHQHPHQNAATDNSSNSPLKSALKKA